MFTDTLLDLFPVSGCCKLAMVFDGLVWGNKGYDKEYGIMYIEILLDCSYSVCG